MADTPPDFTPVTLITGFLGSGKRTLLQRLLLDPALSDTAVLINEFGEIGLDHHLLERIDETMVMLQSGCVCCTIRGELSTLCLSRWRLRHQPLRRHSQMLSAQCRDPSAARERVGRQSPLPNKYSRSHGTR